MLSWYIITYFNVKFVIQMQLTPSLLFMYIIQLYYYYHWINDNYLRFTVID